MNTPILHFKKRLKKNIALITFGVYFLILASNISGILFKDFGLGDAGGDQWQVSSRLLMPLTLVGITNADDHEKSFGISNLSALNQPIPDSWERVNPVNQKLSLFIFQRYECGRSPPALV
ncbi:MAG: hypothetical protein AB7S78_13725 [Candidatus Omnitrophota bacterium]